MKKPIFSKRIAGGSLLSACLTAITLGTAAAQIDKTVMYVTQVPTTTTTDTIVSIGGSHLATTKAAPRGGDLWIRYDNGSFKNITLEGRGPNGEQYGERSGIQGADSIAVRDPQVHWSGTKAVFSMVVGAPTSAADSTEFFWQLYEVTNFGQGQTPVITRVESQPVEFNNIQPTYGSNDEIFFVSDRTLNGTKANYPSRNEQGGVSVTGLWKLEPSESKVTLIDHSPSGSFKPTVDSFGRVVFSRWDHLQRDETANNSQGVDYASEEAGATFTGFVDVFPEATTAVDNVTGHKFDLFLPWTVNQDGTGLLTMNHLGRHELGSAFKRSVTDSNLVDVNPPVNSGASVGQLTRAGSYLHITECPSEPGMYVATDAVSSAVSGGRLVTFSAKPETVESPASNPDNVTVMVNNNSGIARDPSFLSGSGRLMATVATGPVITTSYGGHQTQGEIGTDFIPNRDNPFKITVSPPSTKTNLQTGTKLVPTNFHTANVTNIVDGSNQTFSGQLWELQPVEVRIRTIAEIPPSDRTETLQSPEKQMFREAGVSVSAFKSWLKENDLAMVVSRNVTSRDANDKQQPFNLKVGNGGAGSVDGNIDTPDYIVKGIQFFQGDYTRGYNATGFYEQEGRRVKATNLHADKGANRKTSIPGGTEIGHDGSMAMIVPAKRALTWQLVGTNEAEEEAAEQAGHPTPENEPIVRERYWLSFSSGEVRLCVNCHGSNTSDQVGRYVDDPRLANPPEALKTLLEDWKTRHPEANASVSQYQFWAEENLYAGAQATDDFDGDRITNMEEWAYGTDPSVTETGAGAAQPLASKSIPLRGENRMQVSFTRNLAAYGLSVKVEASRDLKSWTEVSSLEGTDISSDSSVRISTAASPEQTEADLQLIRVTDLSELEEGRPRYFRLRFLSE